jgi:hypothetical protein
MARKNRSYILVVRCTVDEVQSVISMEKKCPFIRNQVDSRYASSWGSQYEIVYSCKLKKDVSAIKTWWSKNGQLDNPEFTINQSCSMYSTTL